MQKRLKELNDMELLKLHNELENLSGAATNITLAWVTVPVFSFDDIVSEALDLRHDRLTKPIFIINLKKDIKDILADRYIEQLLAKQGNIRLAV